MLKTSNGNMKKLSVIIPSYHEPLLQKMIDSLFENSELGNELEIVVVLDGYWPDPPLKDDPRIRILHLGKNRGMRDAINAGVAISIGDYIMRSDGHCLFGKGFDRILLERFEDNWIVTPRRYFLDTEKWEVMDIPPIDYEKLAIMQSRGKFTGYDWKSRTTRRRHEMVDETMAMQGSCWIMKRTWWDKVIGELQTEGYGPHYQDSMEMTFKTWQAGGKLMVNKNTWFAHKHRKFKRTHNVAGADADVGFKYAMDLWKDYYFKEIKPKWGI